MIKKADKNAIRKNRHRRTRKNIFGTAEKPRLNVYRSTNHIYVQFIDDTCGNTLASASTLDAEVKAKLSDCDKKAAAKIVGTRLAEKAKAAGIETCAFDRSGYRFHGRVAALAQAAREAGLKF